ncbi:MAG: flagellar basal-body rod protein FlgF [Candidatus Loosdrechtia sp.]|uniref:flagellar hook-basal body protein n=1 Tax=Candidatus Loosdrechtia sp. TaxID=3101272 RepID=UPI003A622590|nr:MAG: flagellar basal-body rod protein FlgF [Candidatus Jettenia sp. AMX2]
MINGIKLASAGLDFYTNVQEVIARNLANANTVGFKKNIVSFNNALAQTGGEGTSNLQINYGVDYSQGNLIYTGNPLDIAIEGDGFFVLETDKGLRYTRNGQFLLSGTGEIVTAGGLKLLGQGGPVIIPSGGKEIVIDKTGIIAVDGKETDSLMIVNFKDITSLVPSGDSTFSASLELANLDEDVKSRVSQGYLESSNVNVVMEMVDMIANMRNYEASNNVIKSFSGLMERLISNQSNAV